MTVGKYKNITQALEETDKKLRELQSEVLEIFKEIEGAERKSSF